MLKLYPRLVLDYGASDLVRLALAAGNEQAHMEAIDRRLAQGRPFATALSVRTAFDLLLSALDIQPGDEIVISAITIPGMASIARLHRLRVRVADIEPDTLAVSARELERRLTERTRAVLLAPVLGSHQDMAGLARLCHARGIPLIEDAAQSWDGEYRGSPHADVVLFSFGPAKTATALAGAVAVFRDAGMAQRFRRMERELPRQTPSWLAWRIAKFAGLLLFRSPAMLGLVDRLGRLAGIDTDAAFGGFARSFRGPNLATAIRRRLPRPVLHVMAHKLQRHPGADERRQRARQFIGLLDGSVGVPGRACPNCSFWLTAVTVPNPEGLVARLRAAGYDATCGASNLKAMEDDETGTPPNAAAMMSSLVYMPLTRYTGARELEQIAAVVNLHVREERAQPRPAALRFTAAG